MVYLALYNLIWVQAYITAMICVIYMNEFQFDRGAGFAEAFGK